MTELEMDTAEIEIDLHKLRTAINTVLDHLESKGQLKIALTKDYYWDVDEEARYVIDKPEVGDLTAGQLSDDWDTVVQLSNGKKELLSWHLVPISAILRWLGESEVT
jgi:hypothetical protein